MRRWGIVGWTVLGVAACRAPSGGMPRDALRGLVTFAGAPFSGALMVTAHIDGVWTFAERVGDTFVFASAPPGELVVAAHGAPGVRDEQSVRVAPAGEATLTMRPRPRAAIAGVVVDARGAPARDPRCLLFAGTPPPLAPGAAPPDVSGMDDVVPVAGDAAFRTYGAVGIRHWVSCVGAGHVAGIAAIGPLPASGVTGLRVALPVAGRAAP